MSIDLCRCCGAPLATVLVDLGDLPPANRLILPQRASEPEPLYPHKVWICGQCGLAQLTRQPAREEAFTGDYVYFSSFAPSWVEHARRHVEAMTERCRLGAESLVVEIASNDGYLLQFFRAKGIPCLGVDPAADAAAAAAEKGVETIVDFFGRASAAAIAAQRGRADVIIGNNVLAHVPDLHDFVGGIKALLKPDGVVTMEFPHLLQLLRNVQFDTIYNEHYSYLSAHVVQDVFRRHGLTLFRIEALPTHGGSLRIFARHTECTEIGIEASVAGTLAEEVAAGLLDGSAYVGFQAKVDRIREDFRRLVAETKAAGRRIAGFGAAAKGNILLNYCKIGADSLDFVVDDTPAKQGKLLPQSHIPVVAEQVLKESRPDLVVILPWNVKDEIMARLAYAQAWGCRFATCVPFVSVTPADGDP